VVGVGVHGAVEAEGEDDVRADRADAFDDVACELGEGLELELAVLVVEDLVLGDAEDVAGGGELLAAQFAELFGGGCGAAIGAGLAVGEAEDVGFYAACGGEREGSAEGKALVVGVGDDQE
jgi:hypothetical protein